MNFSDKFKFCPACGSASFVVHNIKSKQCDNCGFIYYVNPSAATAAFIRNTDGDLLVCRRSHEPAKGTLDLPGGFIDYNETAEQGIAREVMEELGNHCDEFLVHAVDVEGKANGIETELADLLSDYTQRPVTYAGGVGSMEDLKLLKKHGKDRLDVTVGSALDLFGGTIPFETLKNLDDLHI